MLRPAATLCLAFCAALQAQAHAQTTDAVHIAAPPALRGLRTAATVGSKFCGQWDSLPAGSLTVYNNQWGKSDDPKGWQCTTVTKAVNNNALAWQTSYSWGGTAWQVKSYTNVKLTMHSFPTVREIKSLKTQWNYAITESKKGSLNAAYDLFFADDTVADSNPKYELMVWVAARNGAGPLGTKDAKPLTVNGAVFDLYVGTNGNQKVYSYKIRTEMRAVNFDLNTFIQDARARQLLPPATRLKSVQAGHEVFSGVAVLSTSLYSVQLV